MPYKTGSWGQQAKERSKRRLDYFRKYRREKRVLKLKLGWDVSFELVSKTIQRTKGLCENCGEEGELIHHKNGNHKHNVLENLQILCRKCHSSIHNAGEKNYCWLGDKASPHAKYMREWRKDNRREKHG